MNDSDKLKKTLDEFKKHHPEEHDFYGKYKEITETIDKILNVVHGRNMNVAYISLMSVLERVRYYKEKIDALDYKEKIENEPLD